MVLFDAGACVLAELNVTNQLMVPLISPSLTTLQYRGGQLPFDRFLLYLKTTCSVREVLALVSCINRNETIYNTLTVAKNQRGYSSTAFLSVSEVKSSSNR